MMRKTVTLTLMFLAVIAGPAWSETGSIGKDRVNVRSGPGHKYKVMFQAPLGYPVEIISQNKGWLKIRDWHGNTGWVDESLVSKTQTAVVLEDRVNVRQAPGIGNDVLCQVEKGDIYKVLAEKANWVQIGYYYEGDVVGWIREDLVFGN